MSIIQGNAKTGASRGFYDFEIDQSLRFNSGDSAYLSRTTGSATNTYTFSTWLKRGDIPAADYQYIFSSSNAGLAIFKTGVADVDELYVYNGSSVQSTDVKVRDPSSWYHVVLSVNSGTAAVYLNGVAIKTGLSAASLSTSSGVTRVGRYGSGNFYFDGYLAETHLVTGSALTPSSFGETKTDIWVPKEYTGSHGNDGFKLTYADSSAFGDDTSGEGHDLTSNNFATTDKVLDTPTNNFCVMNPQAPFGTPSAFTLADGNLDLTFTSSSGNDSAVGTMGLTSGKWYHEVTLVSHADDSNAGFTTAEALATETATDGAAYHKSAGYHRGDRAIIWGTEPTPTQRFTTLSDGSVLGFALDLDSTPQTLKIYLNGGASPIVDVELPTDKGDTWIPCCGDDGGDAGRFIFNFGANGFTHTPPSGHVGLSTANLPDPAINPAQGKSPEDYFEAFTWTGEGNAGRSFTDLSFQPDWVWAKDRTSAFGHVLFDSVRGAGADKELGSQSTGAEGYASSSTYDYLSSFDSNGFTSTFSGSNFAAYFNKSGDSYVAWNWKAGGATSADNSAGVGATPTAGSVKIDGANLGSALAGTIAATRLSASTEAGFSVTIYTGNGSNNSTVAHGLGVVPSWVITKSRDNGTDNWAVFHSGLTSVEHYLQLNLTGASASGNDRFGTNEPTSSVMNLGYSGSTNTNGRSYVMYAFAEKEGFSKFGTYDDRVVGSDYENTSPFVYTGFRPAWLMIKGTSAGREWVMYDNKRTPDNGVYLRSNTSAGEQTDATNHDISFLSNGFKIRGGSGDINTTGESYVYMCFADQPFKYANGGTE